MNKRVMWKCGATLAVSGAMVAAVTACGAPNAVPGTSNGGDTGHARLASGQQIVLKVPPVEGPEFKAMRVMYDLFEKDHPNIKLQEVTVSDISAALAANAAPDLMMMDPDVAKDAYKQHYIAPLDQYYKKYGWSKIVVNWARNAYSMKGVTLGIPWDQEGVFLYYNKDMFKKYGWKVPQNYNQLVALSKQIQSKGIIPLAWGTSDCTGCDDWMITEIVNSELGPKGTAQLFSGNKKWTDPVLQDAFQRYVDFWNAGYVTKKKSYAISQESSMQLYSTQRAAMRLDGSWSLSADNHPAFQSGYAPFPSWKPNGKPVIPLGVGGGFVVNAKSKHIAEVAELLNYFFKPQVIEAMAKQGVLEPVKGIKLSNMKLSPNVAAGLKLIYSASTSGTSGYVGWSYESPRVEEETSSNFASVYLKKVTVQAWLSKLESLKEKDKADGVLYPLSDY
ncbi:MAG: ABC transporter substrate-binding protein [Alicyclobacillus sp.]|nr:ABC transporter substrate-binding protein [Alicyclobacillus sp.]